MLAGREPDDLVAGTSLDLLQILDDGCKVTLELLGVFQAESSHFLDNGILHGYLS